MLLKFLNCTHIEMIIHIKNFVKKSIDYSETFFYYAGHGMQIDSNNYIIATYFAFINKTSAVLNSYCMNYKLNIYSYAKFKNYRYGSNHKKTFYNLL